MIKNGVAKELRHYGGAIGIFIFVIGILVFLSYNEIPSVNKDVIVSIIGMIVGSLSVVIMTVIGRNPDEVNELKKTNMIDQLTLLGANAFDTIYSRKKQCVCGKDECKCEGE